jgi:gamma-glutamylcyclotransferase (GGCT)/AIG2-like uncharacterized protein YtfP
MEQSKLVKAFFYGTLKRNEPNSEHLTKQRCQFICEAVTVEKWPLIVVPTAFNLPFLLNKKGTGKVRLLFITK